MDIGAPRGFDHFFFGRVEPAVEDIFPYRAVKEEDVLLDDADILSQRLERDVVDVDAVDRHAAG